jgi:hypothetical protein
MDDKGPSVIPKIITEQSKFRNNENKYFFKSGKE